MKQLLLTTLAVSLFVGCGESQQSTPQADSKPAKPVAEVQVQQPAPPPEAKTIERAAEVAQPQQEAKLSNTETEKALIDTKRKDHINAETFELVLAPNMETGKKLIDEVRKGVINVKTIELLIAQGANVNERDKSGSTPLHNAAEWGHLDVCRILIKSGAKVNSTDYNQRTPVFQATSMGEIEIINFLAKRGAKINVKDIHGFTPASLAAFTGNIESMKALISNGASLTPLGYNEETALHLAVLMGHKEMVKFLIENNKVDVKAKTSSGFTAKQLSEEWARPKIKSFFDNNINTHQIDNAYSSFKDETIVPAGNFNVWNMPLTQLTPIYSDWNKRELIQGKKPIITNKIINFDPQKPVTVKVVCQALLTKIHLTGYTPIPIGKNFIILVENGKMFDSSSEIINEFTLETINGDGDTPLHDAASTGNYSLVKLLVESGAKINSKNNRGKTPLDITVGYPHTDELLRKHGGKTGEELKAEGK